MSKLVSGDPEKDFFEQNPDLKIAFLTDELKKKYSGTELSKIFWSIYLYSDLNSKLYRIPEKERLLEIQRYYKFNPDEYRDLISVYNRYVFTKEETLYRIQISKLDEITAYLSTLSLDDDTGFKKSMQIMGKLSKIWNDMEVVKNRMIESSNKTNMKGGAKESARESRNK